MRVIPDALAGTQKLRDRVSIVTMDGLHGHLLDHFDPQFPDVAIGGAALISSEIRRKREEVGELLLLSGGDFFQGPPIATRFDGEPVIRYMNRDRFDAMTLGNHDLDKGQGVLSERIGQARFPVLAANLMDSQTGRHVSETGDHLLGGVKEYFIKKIGPCTVCVIGLMKADSSKTTHPENVTGLRFENPDETLERILPKICEKERPDVIVLQYQLLREGGTDLVAQAQELAEEHSGRPIPVVLMGGHSYHDFEEPRVGNNTLMLQSGDRGEELSELDLKLAPGTAQVVGFEHRRVPITSKTLRPDPAVAALIKSYKDKLDAHLTEVVAQNETPLTRDKNADSPLGNLVTDIMRETAGADVAVMPGGSLKDDIEAGPVDVAEVYSAFPFESHVVSVELSGANIRKLMEESVGLVAKKVLQVSGLQVTFDPDKPVGERILEINQADGQPIDDEKMYKVAADDFLVAGGDNYTAMKGVPLQRLDKVQDLLVAQLRNKGRIPAQAAGERIRVACSLQDRGDLSRSA